MPTILRNRGFRFFFYSSENGEPPHIHVEKDEAEAKYWLLPVSEVFADGFTKAQLRFIRETITENRDLFVNSYHAYFKHSKDTRS
ncbi:MAG TPA: DUF4160 domain-containing protein [Candidatus Kapabacteria bacterium]|jgi:hypothetical protein|nr:DUF4160 domain-containing protein [Candidatus Kapabacteria bacterium]